MRSFILMLLLPLILEAQWTALPNTSNFELIDVHPNFPEIIFERNLMTVNNGQDWLDAYPAPLSSIHAYPNSPDTLFFVGDTFRSETSNPLYRSFDGGQSWTFLGTSPTWEFPEYSYITDMSFVDGVIHASMDYGGYTYSSDWGETWQSCNNTYSPNNSEIEVATTNPPTIYLGSRAFGSPGRVERTIDFGQTWETVLGNSESVDVLDLKLDPTDNSILYAVCLENSTEKAVVYRLSEAGKEIIFESEDQAGDRGNIWINSDHPDWLYLAAGCQPVIHVSRDAGASWSSLLGNLANLPNFQWVDNANLRLAQPNHLVASVTINNTRYLYQMTDIGDNIITPIIEPASLELSNYPNPFNPQTTIEFTLSQADEINLTVYNLQGQLVNTLKSGYCTIGTHSVDFDGTNLPSGVYIYVLQTKNFTETRKMVLVK
jgi:hypothetical protein